MPANKNTTYGLQIEIYKLNTEQITPCLTAGFPIQQVKGRNTMSNDYAVDKNEYAIRKITS